MSVLTCRNGDVELAYETFGEPGAEPLLLLMGSGASMRFWHEDFCQGLVERGFQVARMDNRDSGRSSRVPGPYTLADLAADTAAVLDALDWSAAHLVGASLGGMIAQVMAVHQAERVRSLTCVASAPCHLLRVSRPRIGALRKVVALGLRAKWQAPDPGQFLVDLYRIIGSPGYPLDEVWLRRLGVDTGELDPAPSQRQNAAVRASGDRRAELARVRVPALVLHGEADPLQSLHAARATADAVPGARLVTYPGMGHDLPRQLWPTITDEIHTLTQRSTRTA